MDTRAQERTNSPPPDQIDWDAVDRIAQAMAKVLTGEASADGYTATLIVANSILLGVASEYAAQRKLPPDEGARYLREAHLAMPDLMADLVPRASELAEFMMGEVGRH